MSNFPNNLVWIKEIKVGCCVCLNSLLRIIILMFLLSFCEGAIDLKTILLHILEKVPTQKTNKLFYFIVPVR